VVDLVWLVPAFPLFGFLVLLLFGKRLGDPLSGWFATLMMAGAFAVALTVLAGLLNQPENTFEKVLFAWVPAGDFHVDVGFYLDPLSMTLMLVITGIGGLIHLYAVEYMRGDPRYPQFFVYFNLFAFSMLMLVMADNLLLTFLGWEGVGACSYFLISFWFERKYNASAAKKAFVTNRVGDWGYMIGMFMTFLTFGSLSYVDILHKAPGLAAATATFIVLFLFVGVCGKSAQLPLYIWLPDAMAGPTPISALIHAATMVTAGVYLLVRINPLIAVSYSWVPWIIAIVGALTAFVAASVALGQRDIKKVLAYSTVSQLGYMVLAVGCGAYVAAIFHLITHACFKACLFLGAGSTVHGYGDEQDMRRMGALRKVMPVAAACMLVATLAISGVPPFSGFWSKDEILSYALNKSPILYIVGWVTAVMTALYMFRLIYLTYWGQSHLDDPIPDDIAEEIAEVEAEYAEGVLVGSPVEIHDGHAHEEIHPHESPWLMLFPVVILAVLAAIVGFINLPFGNLDFLARWLEPVVNLAVAPAGNQAALPWADNYWAVVGLLIIGALAGGIGWFIAYTLKQRDELLDIPVIPEFVRDPYNQLITAFMGGPGERIFDFFSWFDRTIIDGAVNGVSAVFSAGGEVVRRVQNGYVRSYALGIAAGAIVIVAFVLTRVLSVS
jgi:NADH-quinone oxidoreductase subunit L